MAYGETHGSDNAPQVVRVPHTGSSGCNLLSDSNHGEPGRMDPHSLFSRRYVVLINDFELLKHYGNNH